MQKTFRLLFLNIIFCFVMTVEAYAGVLTFPEDPLCDAKFSGSIMHEDIAQFHTLIERTGYIPITLCLDSASGGNLAVGMEVLRMIWDANVDTLVLPGDTCFSACALIFVAGGNTQGTDVTRQVSRDMFAGARVGFHGPGLDLPQGRLQPTELVVEAHNAAVRVAAELFGINQIRERDEVVLTDFLLSIILQTPSDQKYWIETVGDAILSDISLMGVKYPRLDNNNILRFARNVCANTLAKHPPRESTFQMTSNAFEHYRLTTIRDLDLGIPRENVSSDDWYNSKMNVVAFEDDGYFTGAGGPFWSGSKYYQTWCIFRIPSGAISDTGPGRFDIGIGTIDIDAHEDITENWPKLVPEELWMNLSQVGPAFLLHPSIRIEELEKALTPRQQVADRLAAGQTRLRNTHLAQTFSLLHGYDLPTDTPDFLILRDVDAMECLTKCDKLADQCIGVTYDRWNRFCFLKENAWSTLTRNSKADTYLRNDERWKTVVSELPVNKYVRKGKTFELSGKFAEVSTRNAKLCLETCANDSRCDAVEYLGGLCHLLDSPETYTSGHPQTQIGFFDQDP